MTVEQHWRDVPHMPSDEEDRARVGTRDENELTYQEVKHILVRR